MPRVGDEGRVGRMVDRLDPGQTLDQLRVVAMDVLHQLGLGVGRAGDQHRPGIGDGDGDLMEKVPILRGVAAADRIGLVMDMERRFVRGRTRRSTSSALKWKILASR